jgi:hypothetical protein
MDGTMSTLEDIGERVHYFCFVLTINIACIDRLLGPSRAGIAQR